MHIELSRLNASTSECGSSLPERDSTDHSSIDADEKNPSTNSTEALTVLIGTEKKKRAKLASNARVTLTVASNLPSAGNARSRGSFLESKIEDPKINAELRNLAPRALLKFNNALINRDMAKMTKKEVRAIASTFFDYLYPCHSAKDVIAEGLKGLIAARPDVLPEAAATGIANLTAPTPTPAASAASEAISESKVETRRNRTREIVL